MLHFERDVHAATSSTTDIFKHPDVMLFQRTGTFDVVMTATKQTSLDKNNSIDLAIHTGWNSVKRCEIRVKPATGGLRFLTTEAAFVGSSMEFAKPPEAGVFCFDAIAADTVVTIRFPYSVEQDVADVFAKIEATYVTEADDTFHLAKSLAIPVALALGVNVQDVFKHHALFSRFNVSTASASPLRLYKSELLRSDLFDSSFGVPPANPVFIFPKQPASLMYKVKRIPGAKAGKKGGGRTMYLKLDYSLLEVEMEELIRRSLQSALETTPLTQYSKLVVATAWREFKSKMLPRDLEQATLLGEMTTKSLRDVAWEKHFAGIGGAPGVGEHAAEELSAFLRTWQQANGRLAIPTSGTVDPSSILIPVEIPALSVLHTADIRLQSLIPSPIAADSTSGGLPTVCTNQMLPATLHLKWTRIWDTDASVRSDQEFSYEVTAPADTWLLGGRRKGHFVIPGPSASSPAETMTSTPETEAEIPLILIPLREGWLPYPLVEIREVVNTDGDGGQVTAQGCEVDLRNLGETVRVVGDRSGMTVSLDASGPGGGPLVFESERLGGFKGKIVE